MMSFRVVSAGEAPARVPLVQPRRATLAAASSSMLGFLPVFMVAAQGVLVRAELDFDEAQLGIAVSVFFATGALLAAPGGRLSERLGPRRGMMVTAGATAVLVVLIAQLVSDWATLLVFMGLAGSVNAVAQTSGDLSVARGVPEHVQGLAFGIKTSCLPMATLLAGVAIPVVGVNFGWRASFLAAAGVAAAVAALIPRGSSFRPAPPKRTAPRPNASRSALLVLMLSGALSIGAVNTMGAFYAESALRLDLSPSAAGWWLAVGSLGAVAGRIGFGAVGDRLHRPHLAVVAWLWIAGGIGMAFLAPASSLPLFAVATLVAFTAGSGWTGLFLTAVVRSNPAAPAAATGVVMTGQFAGSVVGPLLFGAAASRGRYFGAWIVTGLALAGAAALLPTAERLLGRARQIEGSDPEQQSSPSSPS